MPGVAVGRYEIRREIGRGGFGAVYEAFDPQLGRTVALKASKPGRSRHLLSEEWIRKEAEAVAKLDHPAIVTIHDVGSCPAGAYLVMELLRGDTLARWIEKGPLPVDEALRIAEQDLWAAGMVLGEMLTGKRPVERTPTPDLGAAMAGDLTKARERNAEMLKRWEKADEDIPLLVEAKAMRDRLAGVATAQGGASSPR